MAKRIKVTGWQKVEDTIVISSLLMIAAGSIIAIMMLFDHALFWKAWYLPPILVTAGITLMLTLFRIEDCYRKKRAAITTAGSDKNEG